MNFPVWYNTELTKANCFSLQKFRSVLVRGTCFLINRDWSGNYPFRFRRYIANTLPDKCAGPLFSILGTLSKPRRRRQRERHQTKGLMSRTMAMHVRYKSLYISLPSSAKQQREMTKFCVLYGTWTTTANISYFHLELHATITHLARARF